MKILCYVRPWNYEQFKHLARNVAPHATLSFCSEHSSVDYSGLSTLYYSYLKHGSLVSDLSVRERDDFISRCRLLRALDKTEAVRHLTAMAQAVQEILIREQPNVVLSLMVDSYLMDLLNHYSKQLGIKFIGLVPTFVNGYFRVTARGHATVNPCAEIHDIDAIKRALLEPTYAPNFNAKSLSSPLLGVLRRWAANIARVPYFFVKRHLVRDVYNYHYWAAQIVSKELVSFLPPSDPGDSEWLKQLAAADKPALYIPLQMVPEATVDYWCDNLEVIDYYAQLEKFISKYHSFFHIVVKEHPSVMGSRPSGFYQNLSRDRRISVAPTYTSSNKVLDVVDAVLVWTGSVGFEAALRGKPVICLGEPYYMYGPRFLKIDPATDSRVVYEHVRHIKSQPVSSIEQDELVGHLAAQLFRGNFKNNGTWVEGAEKDLADCRAMGRALRSLLESDFK